MSGIRHSPQATAPNPARSLLYRVLEPLGPYIVGTWRVRNTIRCNGTLFPHRLTIACNSSLHCIQAPLQDQRPCPIESLECLLQGVLWSLRFAMPQKPLNRVPGALLHSMAAETPRRSSGDAGTLSTCSGGRPSLLEGLQKGVAY